MGLAVWIIGAGLRASTAMTNEAAVAAKPASGAGAKNRRHQLGAESARRAARTVSAVKRGPAIWGGTLSNNFQIASDSQESSGGRVLWFMVTEGILPGGGTCCR